ncbi:MAG: hypothetical protein ACOCUV_02835 [bacterium]
MEKEKQQPDFSGFDFKQIPKANLIKAGIGLFGTIMVMLPWFSFRVSMGPFGSHSATVSGFSSAFGVFIFLGFLGIAVINVLGEQVFKFKAELVDKLNLYGSIGVAALCFIDIIRAFARAGYGGTALPGFGLILAFLSGVALLLFALKIIKIK